MTESLDMGMTGRFRCAVCGKIHAGPPRDIGYSLPDAVWQIPSAERPLHACYTDDFCQLGGRYFIRGILYVPITGEPGRFGWGAWAEVEMPTFRWYWETFDEDGSNAPAHSGTLANELPVYPGSAGSRVKIRFRTPTDRPLLHLAAEDQSLLAREQRSGIDDMRLKDIAHWIDTR